MTGWRAAPLALVVIATACGARAFVPPAEPGTPAPEAVAAWTSATAACRGVQAYSASLHVSGQVESTHRSATIGAAFNTRNQVYMEMDVAFGPPGFRLAGTDAAATLLLPRDKRVLTAPAGDIVEALVGVKLPPKALMAIVSGCVNDAASASDGEQFGALRAVTAGGDRVFLSNASGAWRVAAGQTSGWLVDYPSYSGGWPSRIRLTSLAGRSPHVALTIAASQIDVNHDLPAGNFTLAAPDGYAPLTIEDLRASGPLRDKTGGGSSAIDAPRGVW